MTGAKKAFTRILRVLALAGGASASLAGSAAAQPPPGGHPGCYAKMAYPPVYRTVTEHITGPPVIGYRDVPPVIQHYAKSVLVAPARIEHETIAPVYRAASHWIEVPGPARIVTSPPVYRIVTERRLISPAHLVWRPGGVAHGFAESGGYGQDGYTLRVHPTGEVLCRVLIPARYGWTSRRVLVSPARQTALQGPARHVEIHDRVLVQPGRTVEHTIPAVYRNVDATRIVRPASRQRIVSPGPVRTVVRRMLVSPARYGWSPIVCLPKVAQPYPAAPSRPAYGGQSYGAAPPASIQAAPAHGYGDGGYGAAQPPGHAYRPDEIVAPTPAYPPTGDYPAPLNLVPAPYDVGHPARR